MGNKTSKNTENGNDDNRLLSVRAVIESKKSILAIMKQNRSKFEEEKWTDAEIQEADALIFQMATFINELNAALA